MWVSWLLLWIFIDIFATQRGKFHIKNLYAVQCIYNFRLRVAQTLKQFVEGTAIVNSVVSFIFRRWDPPGGWPSSSKWKESARDWGFNGITIQVSSDDTVRLTLRSLNNTAKWALISIKIYNPMERIENLIRQKLIYEFPTFYGTRTFITFLTRSHVWPLFWTPTHRISLLYIEYYPPIYYLVFQAAPFLQIFVVKICTHFHSILCVPRALSTTPSSILSRQ
jgi:hypothetical protein